MPFFVYMMASWRRVIYIGITNDLHRRVAEHKLGKVPGFTAKYNVHHLVFWEVFEQVGAAIRREKQMKSYRRSKKVHLIEQRNPSWHDLAIDGSPYCHPEGPKARGASLR